MSAPAVLMPCLGYRIISFLANFWVRKRNGELRSEQGRCSYCADACNGLYTLKCADVENFCVCFLYHYTDDQVCQRTSLHDLHHLMNDFARPSAAFWSLRYRVAVWSLLHCTPINLFRRVEIYVSVEWTTAISDVYWEELQHTSV
jgi:hypothetical protein